MVKSGKGRQQSVYMKHEIWDEVSRRAKADRRSENKIIEMILEDTFSSPKERVIRASKKDHLI